MATEASAAFDRAADRMFRVGRKSQTSLAWARQSFHGSLNGLVFFCLTLGTHWIAVGRATNWFIAHAFITACCLMGVVSTWGALRVAEAELRERSLARED